MANLNAVVVRGATTLTDHAWPVLIAVMAPIVIVCVTTIVLVFAVERGKRVEAIQALPDLISVIVYRTRSHSIESSRDSAPSSTSPASSEPCTGRRDEDAPQSFNS